MQGYTSIQEDIKYEPTQQSFVYEVEDLVREALKRDIRYDVLRLRAAWQSAKYQLKRYNGGAFNLLQLKTTPFPKQS